MKNFIKVLFLIFSILAIQEQACLGDEYDFRKTKWGMSKNQVLKTEQSKPVCNDCFSDSSSDSVLGYNSKVLGKSVAVVYFTIILMILMISNRRLQKNMGNLQLRKRPGRTKYLKMIRANGDWQSVWGIYNIYPIGKLQQQEYLSY
jgi:hypothetical protein